MTMNRAEYFHLLTLLILTIIEVGFYYHPILCLVVLSCPLTARKQES